MDMPTVNQPPETPQSPAEMRRLREAKRRVCSHAAAIVALTRKYYTAGE